MLSKNNGIKIGYILFVLLVISNIALAQACPPGIPAGAPGCVPPDVYNSQFGTPQPKVIKEKWADRWGAMAIDGEAGSLGAVEGMRSKRSAEKSALKKCKSGGGNNCVISISYFNQCASMVNGSKQYYTQSSPSLDGANKYGIARCAANDSNCRVYYSACSMAEKIR